MRFEKYSQNQNITKHFKLFFDPEGALIQDLNTASKVNFKYRNGGAITSEFAANVYGNQYIQIDSKLKGAHYVEKFLLLENIETKNHRVKNCVWTIF